MFVSLVCGIVSSKFKRKLRIQLLASVVIGTFIGILGALGVFGVVYPFYIAVDTEWFGIPEVIEFGVFIIIPQIKIFEFQSDWNSSKIPLNPVVAILFAATSVVGVIIGQASGLKWFSRGRE